MSATVAEVDAAPAPYEVAPAQPQQKLRLPLGSLNVHVGAAPATRSWGGSGFGILVRFGAWAYFLAVVAVWLLLRLAAERWWPATMLLFAPRWNFAIPLAVLVPAALVSRAGRRALPLLGAAAGIVAFPVMDVRIPWRQLAARATAAVRPGAAPAAAAAVPTLRLLTCNVHGVELDVAALGRYLAECRPDVVVLQGWLPQQRAGVFPAAAGWHVAQDGQLCVASRRFVVTRIATIVPPTHGENGMTSAFAVHVDGSFGGGTIQLIDVHVDSPHRAFAAALCAAPGAAQLIDANTERRLRHVRAVSRYADSSRSAATTTILAGDFNMPDDSPVYRAAFPASGRWTDAFAGAGWGIGNTYFGGGTAARIDHVLCDGRHGWRCVECTVGPWVGSPHRPVVAELEWVGGHGEGHLADGAVVVDVSH
jgi:vancomycin resistance protein VanJ